MVWHMILVLSMRSCYPWPLGPESTLNSEEVPASRHQPIVAKQVISLCFLSTIWILLLQFTRLEIQWNVIKPCSEKEESKVIICSLFCSIQELQTRIKTCFPSCSNIEVLRKDQVLTWLISYSLNLEFQRSQLRNAW